MSQPSEIVAREDEEQVKPASEPADAEHQALTVAVPSAPLPPVIVNSLRRVTDSLNHFNADVAAYIQYLNTDRKTGLMKYEAGIEAIEAGAAEARRQNASFALVMFDIDHFKRFNNTHGHLAGDRVLGAVGDVIAREIRNRCRAGDTAVRFGGEELLVALSATDEPGAKSFAERVRCEIGSLVVTVGSIQLRVTISAGVACLQTGESVMSAIDRADTALYRAKSVRNLIRCWEESHGRRAA